MIRLLLAFTFLIYSGASNSQLPLPGETGLSWNPNPDTVVGYIVFHGNTSSTATKQLAVVPHPVDATRVNYTINDAAIGWTNGVQVCFRLKAYNDFGMSGFSDSVCATKKLIAAPTGLKLGVSSVP